MDHEWISSGYYGYESTDERRKKHQDQANP
jgi:hypothetical protein